MVILQFLLSTIESFPITPEKLVTGLELALTTATQWSRSFKVLLVCQKINTGHVSIQLFLHQQQF